MGYLDMGLRRGDHIGIWGFNTVEWYLSYLAAFRAGLVAVCVNNQYQYLFSFFCPGLTETPP